ncbi:AraC family transcriptional regulator [Rathayibacter sp. PhB185]|uniref:helix-turn-helix domain-containing protein n=2 Tax=unclassified Rathayibacter TaxID=2609250 RepID=UPI000FB9EB8A|nr:AraC family transcriptional regulator [Rathayibacter sp. PhB185]ROP50568.1 AraC-like DNA-binding protein [Rathayibacter sp. PhB186]ROS53527.1 AraC-like DNA-binding protein [Rathayibacter sp. PhB185]
MSVSEHLRPGGAAPIDADPFEWTSAALSASRSRVVRGTGFDAHVHQEDQLAWMASGSMELGVLGDHWHLRREHMAWIPAGVPHEMAFVEPGELISVYVDPVLRPRGERWGGARTLRLEDLAGSLVLHLTDSAPSALRRRRCWLLLGELLDEAPDDAAAVALPRDPRARAVATALLEDPADPRELAEWAVQIGVSTKTIARAFAAETGSTFREWRVRARMHSAIGMLVRGDAVQTVAPAVGYDSVSSFIVAFRARLGSTPAVYAARARG